RPSVGHVTRRLNAFPRSTRGRRAAQAAASYLRSTARSTTTPCHSSSSTQLPRMTVLTHSQGTSVGRWLITSPFTVRTPDGDQRCRPVEILARTRCQAFLPGRYFGGPAGGAGAPGLRPDKAKTRGWGRRALSHPHRPDEPAGPPGRHGTAPAG